MSLVIFGMDHLKVSDTISEIGLEAILERNRLGAAAESGPTATREHKLLTIEKSDIIAELAKNARFPQLVGAAIACEYPPLEAKLSASQIHNIMKTALIEIGVKEIPSTGINMLQKELALLAKVDSMRATIDVHGESEELFAQVRKLIKSTNATDLDTIRLIAIDIFRGDNEPTPAFDVDVFPYTVHKLLGATEFKNRAARLDTYYAKHSLNTRNIDNFNLFLMTGARDGHDGLLAEAGKSCHAYMLNMLKGAFKAYSAMSPASTFAHAAQVSKLGEYNPHCVRCRIGTCPLFAPHDTEEWFALLSQKW